MTPRNDATEEPKDGGRGPKPFGRNILLAILVGLAINVLLGFFVDFDKFKLALSHTRPWQVLLPFGAIVLVYLVDSFRYLIMFRQFGIRLGFGDALYNNVIGYFFCNVTPSSAGGQPFQVYHFSRLGLETATATNVIFSRLMVTNFVQLLTVFVFAKRGIELLATSGNGAYVLGLGMATTAIVSVFLLLVFLRPTLIGRLALSLEHSRLGRLIGRAAKDDSWAEKLSAWSFSLRDSFRYLWTERTWAVILDSLLFLCVQAIWYMGLYFPLNAISGVTLPFGDFLFAFIVCGLVSAYIPTPGASGSVEASYALVLGGMTGSFGHALSAVMLWRLGSYYLHLILGGLVYGLLPLGKELYERLPDGSTRRKKVPEALP